MKLLFIHCYRWHAETMNLIELVHAPLNEFYVSFLGCFAIMKKYGNDGVVKRYEIECN